MRENSATDQSEPTYPDVPMPAGAVSASEWCDTTRPDEAIRIIHGRVRSVGPTLEHLNGDTSGLCEVETSACQYLDGTLDTGPDGPLVQVHIYSDDGLTAAQAREVAALMMEAADEVEGWQR